MLESSLSLRTLHLPGAIDLQSEDPYLISFYDGHFMLGDSSKRQQEINYCDLILNYITDLTLESPDNFIKKILRPSSGRDRQLRCFFLAENLEVPGISLSDSSAYVAHFNTRNMDADINLTEKNTSEIKIDFNSLFIRGVNHESVQKITSRSLERLTVYYASILEYPECLKCLILKAVAFIPPNIQNLSNLKLLSICLNGDSNREKTIGIALEHLPPNLSTLIIAHPRGEILLPCYRFLRIHIRSPSLKMLVVPLIEMDIYIADRIEGFSVDILDLPFEKFKTYHGSLILVEQNGDRGRYVIVGNENLMIRILP